MTEPVAYMLSDFVGNDFTSLELPKNPNNPRGLYFKEQLQPRVKMTKKQYDRLMWDKQNTDLFQCIDYFQEHDGNSKFGVLKENLRGDLIQEDIARAWLSPEETIEIVPDMKWFVRSKKTNGSYKYDYLSRMYDGTASPKYGKKDLAIYFDTKEEAEKWTNPLTEAVQLPVEEK
ncbi:hypothetical protein [Leuconostoc mesenteroides]|uniref:hypothetical protein n=1 Tax=Leuconostoc mesenteroides TaxID=1245 RepID=UPI0023608A79|nr:hypothetical protein [Leuconostoc mesenteroides]